MISLHYKSRSKVAHFLSTPNYQNGFSSHIFVIAGALSLVALFCLGSVWIIISKSRTHPTSTLPTSPTNPNATQPVPPTSPFTTSPTNPTATQPVPPASPFTTSPPSPFTSSTKQLSAPTLDKAEAKSLVKRWLTLKKSIYSPPYDHSNLASVIVNPGPLYQEITKPNGTIDWLRKNKSHYNFKELQIISIVDFEIFPDRVHISVQVLEDLELITPKGIDKSKSSRKKQNWVYELKYENGSWLIYDYRKVS